MNVLVINTTIAQENKETIQRFVDAEWKIYGTSDKVGGNYTLDEFISMSALDSEDIPFEMVAALAWIEGDEQVHIKVYPKDNFRYQVIGRMYTPSDPKGLGRLVDKIKVQAWRDNGLQIPDIVLVVVKDEDEKQEAYTSQKGGTLRVIHVDDLKNEDVLKGLLN